MCCIFPRSNLVGLQAPFLRTGCVRLHQRARETVEEKKMKQYKDLAK